MKKLNSLLICCSLALAGAALAQQPSEEASPNPAQGAVQKSKAHGQKAASDAAKAPAAAADAAKAPGAAAAQTREHVKKGAAAAAPQAPTMKAPTGNEATNAAGAAAQ